MSVSAPRQHKRVLCQFNMHKWVRRLNPQGEDYQQCNRAGKISMTSSGPNSP